MTSDDVDGASFADPATEFYLPSSGTPVDVDGLKLGEPTGEVLCMRCCREAMNVDEIEHKPSCPQRHVHSNYYRRGQGDG